MLKAIKKNWKTTLSGIAIAVLVYLQQIEIINEHQFTLITSILISLGFIFSKDSGEKEQEDVES